MLFDTYEFILIFLPITFFMYFYLNKKKMILAGKIFIVFASLFFYSWWNIIYLPILLLSVLFNYFISRKMLNINNIKKKKFLLFFGLLCNLLLLMYFKYMDFFIDNINFLFDSELSKINLLLPLAISFFTFQQIAFLVDNYKGIIKDCTFLNYILFVTFFPQLIAGPIVHHKEMMPQFISKKNIIKNYKNILNGLFIFFVGLFKKVIIADTFAGWANYGFDESKTLSFFEGWGTSLSYTFQLYYDFSGYTDMAIGAALLFNIKLPYNFNSPYKAINIQDFWRRWHITLSRFLKDYIYIPLGGSYNGHFSTYTNLMITFLLGGLWHGAGWTFILWGLLHGVALIIHRLWVQLGFKLWCVLSWFITFNFVNIAWIFFRANNLDDAQKVLYAMFTLKDLSYYINLKNYNFYNEQLLYIILVLIGTLIFKNSNNGIKMIRLNKFKLFLLSLLSFYLIYDYVIPRENVKSIFIYVDF